MSFSSPYRRTPVKPGHPGDRRQGLVRRVLQRLLQWHLLAPVSFHAGQSNLQRQVLAGNSQSPKQVHSYLNSSMIVAT